MLCPNKVCRTGTRGTGRLQRLPVCDAQHGGNVRVPRRRGGGGPPPRTVRTHRWRLPGAAPQRARHRVPFLEHFCALTKVENRKPWSTMFSASRPGSKCVNLGGSLCVDQCAALSVDPMCDSCTCTGSCAWILAHTVGSPPTAESTCGGTCTGMCIWNPALR